MSNEGDHAMAPDRVVHNPFQRRMILTAMCVALMAVIASVAGLNVAQQELALEFGASQGEILWIINIYTLTLAAFLMPIGAIGDRWGRKQVLLLGLGTFTVASLVALFAGSTEVMIVARAIAGLGAAMIMPVTLSVITSTFPAEDRAQAIGIWTGVAGGGGMVGMFVSAAMVDLVTWQWLFAFPIALTVFSFVLSARFVPNSREDKKHPFDGAGSVLSALAIGGLVLGIHEGPEKGWSDPLTIIGLAVGVIALVAFVIWELGRRAPLLDIRLFADRRLAAGSTTLLSLFAVMSGISLVLFPFFQAVLGWSALRSASAMLPMAVIMMPTSAIVPRVIGRFGSQRTLWLGLGLFGMGVATLALMASIDGGYLSVLPGLLIIGLGGGMSMTPATAAITASLPTDKQGVASAMNDTTRELGGAVGVALLGSILSGSYRSSITPNLAPFPDDIASVAREGIGAAFGVAPQAGAQAPQLIHAAQAAFVDGWVSSMWIGVVVVAVAFLFVLVRGPRRAHAGVDTEVEDGNKDFAIPAATTSQSTARSRVQLRRRGGPDSPTA